MSESSGFLQTFVQRAFATKWLFWLILAVGLVADLATKAWAEAVVKPEFRIDFIDGFVAWKWAVNEGAAFSIMDGRPLLLSAIASAVLVAILIYAYRTKPERKWFLGSLALLTSGALGNLHDRLRFGYVRDFIFFDFELPFHESVGVIPRYWPVFNVADMAILAGVGILMVISFKPSHEVESPAPLPEEEPRELEPPEADAAETDAKAHAETDEPPESERHGP
jgi:signal peptidase II